MTPLSFSSLNARQRLWALCTLLLGSALLVAACDSAGPTTDDPSDSEERSAVDGIPSFSPGSALSVPAGNASVSPSQTSASSTTATLPLADGWNLVSVPLDSTGSVGEAFPSCSAAFVYETGSGYQSVPDTAPLPAGHGAFLNCTADTTSVSGTEPPPTLSLGEGWNLIGPHAQAAATDAISTDPAGILETSFFAFQPGSGYAAADTLRPGNGYWVKAGADGTLLLPASSSPDRIPITFNPKTVGDSLYTGGYSGDLDYTVSTDDTTFTTSGSTTADVPISDGDQLEISTSDSEYLSTIVANNTDTEQPPFSVSGFPDEPDYQNTTINIPKSDVVNEYQVVGFPDTSPLDRNVGDIYVPFVNEATRFKDRQLDEVTLDEDKIYVVESDNEDWNDKAENAISTVRDVMPFPTTPPEFVPSQQALEDSAATRNNFNLTYLKVGSSGNNQFYDSGYIKFTSAFASIGDGLGTTISEMYSSMSDMEKQNGTEIGVYISDDDNNFVSDEAALPPRLEYNTKAGSSLQP